MLRSLGSKLDSLRSIFQVYDNWFGILKVYFLGGETIALFQGIRDGTPPIKVSKDNVNRIISLSKILVKFRDKNDVYDIIRTIRPNFTTEEPYLLEVFCLLGGESKYIKGVVKFDNNHFLVRDINGLKWILRRTSPISMRDDALFGPLLSYYQETVEYDWFSRVLQRGGTFVDVGANVGGYSVRACKMGANVIAVEPDPDNYRVLKLNLELNQYSGAHALNIAAGSREEVRQLYQDDKGTPSGSTLKQGEGRKVKCYIKVKPLDAAITPLLNDEWVDLLKIDVEGFEVEVIKGVLNLLKRTRYVIVEVIPSTESKINEVLELLRPIGFKLIDKVCRYSLYCDLFLSRHI